MNGFEVAFAAARLPAKPEDMSEGDFALLTDLARKIVRRRLSVPAIFFLETAKPLNYVGAQAMVFFGPFVQVLFESPNYERYTELLERRSTLELLLQMIEGYESELVRVEKAEKAERAARKAARNAARRRPAWRFWQRRE